MFLGATITNYQSLSFFSVMAEFGDSTMRVVVGDVVVVVLVAILMVLSDWW